MKPAVSLVGGVLAAAGFAVFFGGNFLDAVFAGVIAMPITVLMQWLSNTKINNILAKLTVCLIGGLLTMIVSFMGLDCNIDKIMIGNIMNVIPGVLLVNSFRDFFTVI